MSKLSVWQHLGMHPRHKFGVRWRSEVRVGLHTQNHFTQRLLCSIIAPLPNDIAHYSRARPYTHICTNGSRDLIESTSALESE